MGSRLELHEELCNILGNKNVYFQPPENLKIKYPCILYELSSIDTIKADDSKYVKNNRYTITLINDDPDDLTKEVLLELKYSRLERVYVSDGLYHYVYTLFY